MKSPTHLPEELTPSRTRSLKAPCTHPGLWEEDAQTVHGGKHDTEEGKALPPGISSIQGPAEAGSVCVCVKPLLRQERLFLSTLETLTQPHALCLADASL